MTRALRSDYRQVCDGFPGSPTDETTLERVLSSSARARARRKSLQSLEAFLGDPADPINPFGVAQSQQRDRHGLFPVRAQALLRQRGFHLNCWPQELQGELVDFELTLDHVRLVAQRDANLVCATLMSIPAALSVLSHGDEAQVALVSATLRAGEDVALAFAEESSGSDWSAFATTLRRDGEHWLLSGRKWLVGNARRAALLLVVAQPELARPGAFSNVLIDARRAELERTLKFEGPRLTTGLRGIAFFDLQLEAMRLRSQALVGPDGSGFEALLEAQQVARLVSVAACLGCVDAALRCVRAFSRERRAAGTPLADLSSFQEALVSPSLCQSVIEVTSRVAARALHLLPGEFCNWVNVLRWVSSELCEVALQRCARAVGVRAVLPSDSEVGSIEKLIRDSQALRILDGGSHALLRETALHLRALAEAPARAPGSTLLQALFAGNSDLPKFEVQHLEAASGGDDLLVSAVLALLPSCAARLPAGRLRGLVEDVARGWRALLADVRKSCEGSSGGNDDLTLLSQAESYCWLHAAGVCTLVWFHGAAPEAFGSLWLERCLDFLLSRAACLRDDRYGPLELGPGIRSGADWTDWKECTDEAAQVG